MKIYYNGNILNEDFMIVNALVVDNGVIEYIGSNIEALKYAGTKIDLNQKFVLPGFNDSHMHLLGYGRFLQEIQLSDASNSLNGILECLRQKLKALKKGDWLIGRGWNHDYFQDETRFPTKQDLDNISTDVPIYITRTCGHVAIVNSKAIKLAKINNQVIEGGCYNLETGLFEENAIELINKAIKKPNLNQIKEYILIAQNKLNSYGITSIQSDDLISITDNYQDVIDAFNQLNDEYKLTIRIYEQSHLINLDLLKEFINKGYRTGIGNNYFKIGPLKMLGDGSLGARTAFLSQPYYDKPTTSGIAIYTKEEIITMFEYAHKHGMQIAIHTIGDGILDWILEAYQIILKNHPAKDHRHGLVHVQITRSDQLEKIKELKLHAYIQSIFLNYDSKIINQRVVPKTASTSYNFKTLNEITTLSNGSDAPVEAPDVLMGIQLAVTRTPIDDDLPYLKNQGLSVKEAIASFTIQGAYASFEEHLKGKLASGMLADFVILDQNIFKVNVNEIKNIKVLETYVGGNLVYERKQINASK